ncbi:P-type conjugative transfer protein TrbG [Campylobacter coli]|uniref:P-type conjugative transfer protein TrbG n=1 Tax=Campylobacter coli TaxID=195 RepID=UPI001AEFE66A|nr:P-type conjugative transfer protein TrbG [Campylobacter coli]EHR2891311.1 P-type conjugative transfer protein TrbG [Campylobacter coli]EHW5914041.1 P-type conjugative transfer protein TrbG [Campylobacter coli]EIC9914556.1 P-type conjugative transfer protein TrbG [Campylobacter coli]EID5127602.1 P-type conjugative transfer protein TrbG [Campylobacter coli]EID5172355.1 P-type conjugative transfer protein TrbG [Campylobacter coli]
MKKFIFNTNTATREIHHTPTSGTRLKSLDYNYTKEYNYNYDEFYGIHLSSFRGLDFRHKGADLVANTPKNYTQKLKKLSLIASLLLFIGSSAYANNLNERDFANLTPKEKKDLAIAQKWINSKTTTIQGNNGEVIFLFGESMPSIVTAPLRLTDISLEPGEVIKDVQIGDSIRWTISLSISGEEPYLVSHIIVKPTDKNLQTTMNIMTNKRVYRLNLISEAKKFMPAVSFNYPNSIIKTLEDYKNQMKAKSESKNFYKTKDDEIPSNIENLDFGYSVEGNAPFKPLRIYNDGIKTYIQMPKNLKFYEAPALMILDSSNEKQIVNYRLKYDTFIVDRLFNKAILLSNVGSKQEKIKITKHSNKANQDIVNNVLYDLSLQNKKENK